MYPTQKTQCAVIGPDLAQQRASALHSVHINRCNRRRPGDHRRFEQHIITLLYNCAATLLATNVLRCSPAGEGVALLVLLNAQIAATAHHPEPSGQTNLQVSSVRQHLIAG